MKTVEINGKQYQIVKNLSYREGLQIEDHLRDLLDIDEQVKAGNIAEVMAKVKGITETGRKIIVETLKKSLGKTEDEIFDMEYAEVVVLFAKVWKANTEITAPFEKQSPSVTSPTA